MIQRLQRRNHDPHRATLQALKELQEIPMESIETGFGHCRVEANQRGPKQASKDRYGKVVFGNVKRIDPGNDKSSDLLAGEHMR